MRKHPGSMNSNNRLLAGLIILIIGLLFLLKNFNLIPDELRHYIFDWKTLLIAIGALNILFSHNRIGGFILITVGVVFWLPELVDLPIKAGRLLWPIAIMAVGVFILFNEQGFRKLIAGKWQQNSQSDNENPSQDNEDIDDYIDVVSIFGGGERLITSKKFRGGKVTSIFGGSALHFRLASLAPGNQKLDLFFLFGGSEIVVPSNWNVRVDVVSIFGGFSDKRFFHNKDDQSKEATSTLTIKGLVLFGGGELKSY